MPFKFVFADGEVQLVPADSEIHHLTLLAKCASQRDVMMGTWDGEIVTVDQAQGKRLTDAELLYALKIAARPWEDKDEITLPEIGSWWGSGGNYWQHLDPYEVVAVEDGYVWCLNNDYKWSFTTKEWLRFRQEGAIVPANGYQMTLSAVDDDWKLQTARAYRDWMLNNGHGSNYDYLLLELTDHLARSLKCDTQEAEDLAFQVVHELRGPLWEQAGEGQIHGDLPDWKGVDMPTHGWTSWEPKTLNDPKWSARWQDALTHPVAQPGQEVLVRGDTWGPLPAQVWDYSPANHGYSLEWSQNGTKRRGWVAEDYVTPMPEQMPLFHSSEEDAAGFLQEPHDELYPPIWDNLKMRPEAKRMLEAFLDTEITKAGYSKISEWLKFTVFGSGASYNWDENGDLDIHIWVDADAFNKIHPDLNFTSDQLLVSLRRIIIPINSVPLSKLDIDGHMLVQYYPLAGQGTKDECLATRPYACYSMETDEWFEPPEPLSPEHFSEGFYLVEPKARLIAEQAVSLLGALDIDESDALYWNDLHERYDNSKYEERAESARKAAEEDWTAVRDLWHQLFAERQQAYSPKGKGANDERDFTMKLLEVWGVGQRLKDRAYHQLPWDVIDVPPPPDKTAARPWEEDTSVPEIGSKWLYNLHGELNPFTITGVSENTWFVGLQWDDHHDTSEAAYSTPFWVSSDVWRSWVANRVVSPISDDQQLTMMQNLSSRPWERVPEEPDAQLPIPGSTWEYLIYEDEWAPFVVENAAHHDGGEIICQWLAAPGTRFRMPLDAWSSHTHRQIVRPFTSIAHKTADFEDEHLPDFPPEDWKKKPSKVCSACKRYSKWVESSWAQVAEKAQRYRQDGRIHVLRNTPEIVVGRVDSETHEGVTYDTEIDRQDPNNPLAVSMWSCTCPWGDKWAWQRTRRWKKLDGRLCAHATGLLWQGMSLPYDDESGGPDQSQPPAGAPGAPPAGMSMPVEPQQQTPDMGTGEDETQMQPPPPPGAISPGTMPAGPPIPGGANPPLPAAVQIAPNQAPSSSPAPAAQTPGQAPVSPGGPGVSSQPVQPGQGGTVSIPGALSSWKDAAVGEQFEIGDYVEVHMADRGGYENGTIIGVQGEEREIPTYFRVRLDTGQEVACSWGYMSLLRPAPKQVDVKPDRWTEPLPQSELPFWESSRESARPWEKSTEVPVGLEPGSRWVMFDHEIEVKDIHNFGPHGRPGAYVWWFYPDLPPDPQGDGSGYQADTVQDWIEMIEAGNLVPLDAHGQSILSSWKYSAFHNGDIVRANTEMTGEDRDGNQMPISRNSIGEVLESDEITTVVIFPLHETGQLEPHLVKVEDFTSSFSAAQGMSPFIRRRRQSARPWEPAPEPAVPSDQIGLDPSKAFDGETDVDVYYRRNEMRGWTFDDYTPPQGDYWRVVFHHPVFKGKALGFFEPAYERYNPNPLDPEYGWITDRQGADEQREQWHNLPEWAKRVVKEVFEQATIENPHTYLQYSSLRKKAAWGINVTNNFQDWYEDLPEADQEKIRVAVAALEQGGPNLGRPLVGEVAGSSIKNLKELIPPSSTIRIIFCFDPRREAILLTGTDKSLAGWNDWYDQQGKPLAEQLYAEYLQELQQSGELQ